LGVVLVLGVLIGRTGRSSDQASAPQIIRVGGPAGGGTASTASLDPAKSTAIRSTWPSGKAGWTVELGAVPKAGATPASVNAARGSAAAKGAPAVGVLDSDTYGSLPGGDWVVYSGVFDSKAKAAAAAKKLHGKFPSAKVVKVSDGGGGGGGGSPAAPVQGKQARKAINDLNKSGAAYQDQLKKKPKAITVPGAAPKKDKKAPGGGSSGQTIG